MRKTIVAMLLVLIAAPAWATVNTRQNSDGTADFVGSRGQVGNCVGGQNLQTMFDLNTLITRYLVTDITRGVITDVKAVHDLANTGTGLLRVWMGQLTTPMRFVNPVTGLATTASITIGTSAAGTVHKISDVGQISGATRMSDNVVIQNGQISGGRNGMQYIAITNDGNATASNNNTTITVRVCPR